MFKFLLYPPISIERDYIIAIYTKTILSFYIGQAFKRNSNKIRMIRTQGANAVVMFKNPK